MSDFFTAKQVKARKTHKHCWGCHAPIEAGTVYVREVGVFEGDFWSSRKHLGCHWLFCAANEVLNEYPEDGWDEVPELIDNAGAGQAEEARILAYAGPRDVPLAELPPEEQERARRILRGHIEEAERTRARRAWESGGAEHTVATVPCRQDPISLGSVISALAGYGLDPVGEALADGTARGIATGDRSHVVRSDGKCIRCGETFDLGDFNIVPPFPDADPREPFRRAAEVLRDE